jgi:hypothetical protein
MPDPPPWKDSEAKIVLGEDILSGAVTPEMLARAVYDSRPIFRVYPFRNFANNLKSLRQALAKDPGPPPKWATSQAKEQLQIDIVSGAIPTDMPARQVFDMHPHLFHQYEFRNFSNNLKSLRKSIAEDYERMEADWEDYSHDLDIVDRLGLRADPTVRWHGSRGATLLAEDVAEGLHTTMKPSQLYASRPEYRIVSSEQFRKHIYQEVHRNEKQAARFLRKQQKEEKKNKTRAKEQRLTNHKN